MPTSAANRVPARKRTKDFQVLARFSPTQNRSAFANLVRNLLSSDHRKPIRLDEFFSFSRALLSAFMQGYTGRKCERCSAGYYGFPHLPAGKCTPCECNPAGSLNDECDTETGQCRCRAGSTGRDCSECTAYRHVFINNVCTCKGILLSFHSNLWNRFIYLFFFFFFSSACNDNCTGILLDNLAALSQELAEGTVHIADGYVPPPWQELSYIDSNTTEYLEEINRRNRLKQRMKNIPWNKYRELLKEVEVLLRAVSDWQKNFYSKEVLKIYIRDILFFRLMNKWNARII